MTQERNTAKLLLKGTAILTASGLVVKVLSAIYRIPYQNIVGDVGFYIYQQVYPIYGVLVVLGGIGFPVAVSKLIADEATVKKKQQILSAAFIWLFSFACLVFTCLFFGAESIASWMKDVQLAPLIRVVAVAFLLVPLLSLFRGYFQGMGHVLPFAVSQTVEQLIRIVTIIATCFFFTRSGYSLYMVGTGAMFGSIVGGSAAVLCLLLFTKKYRTPLTLTRPTKTTFKMVGKALLYQGFAFCLISMLLVLLQLVDSFQLYGYLLKHGLSEATAMASKGIYDRGQPLLQMGAVVSTSIGLSIVPILAKERHLKNLKRQLEKVQLAMKMSVGLGLGAATGLMLLIRPLNIMLFEDAKESRALMILMISVFLISIALTSAAISQTFGKIRPSIIAVFLAVIVKGIGNALLIPNMGVEGAALASVAALLATVLVVVHPLQKQFSRAIFSNKEIIALILTNSLMVLVLLLYGRLFHENPSRTAAAIHSLTASLLGGSLYILLLFRTNFFTERELTYFPKHEKWQFLLPKRKTEEKP